ncbi:serine hydrolase domain-containing protein [Motilibacter aurantiacus]|uniref:serine hydrolase domain-containing protein n=1 Tax=Motilibacter aurantiacus TaxID=2714955 RepID=UPI00140767A2|nr:serine hydrolase domain-containing protein [Motilibacter aurantiacus]NHC44514.1 beta-lactamase family protein [Motilibacter aurantiacus]
MRLTSGHTSRRRTLSGVALAAVATTALVGTVPADAAGTARVDGTQQRMNALVTEDGAPGALGAVSNREGKIRNYTAGVGDLKTGAKVPADGYIRIASNTKTYTAVVVLQLVGEGKIALDEKVDTYLPGLVRKNGNDGRKITVRQLLQQTSGLPDYDEDIFLPFDQAQRTYRDPRSLVDIALAHTSHFTPGTKWEYSNTNYVLAGLVVEKVTGRPIGEQITHRIIKPLGLKETYWPGLGTLTLKQPHPKGYHRDSADAPYRDMTAFEPSGGWAAGALIATPSDVLTFYRAVIDGKLLEPAQQKEMLKAVKAPGFEPESGWSYGLGIAKKKLSCGADAWGHGGDFVGYESRGLVTEGGRGAVLAVTALPVKIESLSHLNTAVDKAVCEA